MVHANGGSHLLFSIHWCIASVNLSMSSEAVGRATDMYFSASLMIITQGFSTAIRVSWRILLSKFQYLFAFLKVFESIALTQYLIFFKFKFKVWFISCSYLINDSFHLFMFMIYQWIFIFISYFLHMFNYFRTFRGHWRL